MKSATITEAKNGLSALLDRVRAGEAVVITDRGTPVATIEPVRTLADSSGRLERLTRAGLVRPGRTGEAPARIRETPPLRPSVSVDLVAGLIGDREDRV